MRAGTEPDPVKVKSLLEDLEALAAAQDGLLVPHLERLLAATTGADWRAFDEAVRRFRHGPAGP